MARNARSSSNSLSQNIKDYIVPIIGVLIIILIIWNVVRSDNNEETIQNLENRIPTTVQFVDETTEAFIVYPGDNREEITNNASLYKGESIIVKEGKILLEPEAGTRIFLNRVTELKYVSDAEYQLYSSDIWIESDSTQNISMRYGNVELLPNSIVSLTQNEAVSSIYLIAGSARVTNLGGASTSIVGGEKLSLTRQDASDQSINLSIEKEAIDNYFTSSDWFIENNGFDKLSIASGSSQSGSGSLAGSGSISGSGSDINLGGANISFENFRDEMRVSESQVNISGSVNPQLVGRVVLGGNEASILENGSFNIPAITLQNSMNDLVLRVYDINDNLIEKDVFTLYSSNPDTSSVETNTTTTITNTNGVRSFEGDATNFGFTAPSVTGKFSTTSSEVTIRGVTTADGIESVRVNGFELNSFNGSTWRYHAFTRFDTLTDGTNQYKIDYYNASGDLVYTDYYTIVKQAPSSSSTTTENTSETQDTSTSEESNDDTTEPETAI